MAKVNATTIVRNGYTSVVLLKGDTVPDWAVDQVGDHLLGKASSDAEAEQVEQSDGQVEQSDGEIETSETGDEKPTEDNTNAEIKQWAEENGVDLDGATTKADMLAKING